MNTQTNQTNHKTVVYPLVDVLESDKEFLLVADLPGVGKDALDITFEAGQLELRAETPTLEFRRSFAVGDDVNLAAIDAKIERGELVIHLPKRAESRVRRIEVRG
jgi:HSP20 family protein